MTNIVRSRPLPLMDRPHPLPLMDRIPLHLCRLIIPTSSLGIIASRLFLQCPLFPACVKVKACTRL